MATETEDEGPVRIPIEDEPAGEETEESTDGGSGPGIGVAMLLLAVVAAAVIYVVVSGGSDDEEMEPPF